MGESEPFLLESGMWQQFKVQRVASTGQLARSREEVTTRRPSAADAPAVTWIHGFIAGPELRGKCPASTAQRHTDRTALTSPRKAKPEDTHSNRKKRLWEAGDGVGTENRRECVHL